MTPQNTDAEIAVLSAIFLQNDILADLGDTLRQDDFYRQQYRIMYAAMCRLFSRNMPIDLLTVTDELKKSGELDKVGGITTITAVAGASPTAANVEYHVNLVIDAAKRRNILRIAENSKARADSGEDAPDAVLDDMQQEITDVLLRGKADDIQSTQDMLMDAITWFDERAALGDDTGIASGFSDLDKLTHGYQPGDLDIIAARPSMGKTAFALNCGVNACKKGKGMLFFSLEMTKNQLIARALAGEAGIELSRLMNPACLTNEEHSKRLHYLEVMNRWNFHIDDTAGITPADMIAKARRYKARFGLDIIIIDYLQLMSGGKKSENRTQELSFITRSLKQMAKDLQVPVIALSQLSRDLERRQDKHPLLSDLRESGSIEQDADMVMFLYRDDYYNPETDKRYTELIIAKNRNGPLDTVNLFFAKPFTRFGNLKMEDKPCNASTLGKTVAKKNWIA